VHAVGVRRRRSARRHRHRCRLTSSTTPSNSFHNARQGARVVRRRSGDGCRLLAFLSARITHRRLLLLLSKLPQFVKIFASWQRLWIMHMGIVSRRSPGSNSRSVRGGQARPRLF
jgi:hypothetical protein